MSDLNPITREEYFLARMAGENVEIPDPITREEKYMKGIADAISGQNDINIPEPITREEIYAEQIVKNLEEITLDLEEKSITENGEYTAATDNKDGFSKVTVNVPNTYTNEDEGKVVSSGTLVSQSARSESITENGTYDTTMNNAVTIAVAGGNANVADGTGAFNLNSALNRIDIPSGYTKISTATFSGYTSLTSIDLPSTLISIGNVAFQNCTSLTSIGLPSTLTSIGGSVFYGCTSLASVDLPSTLTSIDYNAFYQCTSLASIICRATTPPTLGTNVFSGVPADCPIYVPTESVDTYKAASGWSDRANYIQAIPTA